jgi:hypothetical protein
MTYVRPSSLGVAEFCPRATELNEQSGISRAAIMSTAWHAKLAGNDTLIGELHPDERKEVAGYGTPTDAVIRVPSHYEVSVGREPELREVDITLDYESAEKELHVQVFERDDLITQGTLDFAWVRDVGGQRWAFVADLKRSSWAIPDGPDCLQLAAYGHAYAALRGCVGYTPGLWSGTDSEWTWGTPIDLTSPEALDLWLRLKRAAKNDHRLKTKEDDKRFVTGAHCSACYGRMRCPEYATLADALSNGSPEPEITSETAASMLLAAKALAEHAERITENVKVFAERGGVVKDPTTGKVYLPTVTSGRESLDKEALLKAHPDAKQFWRKGKPGKMFTWKKA